MSEVKQERAGITDAPVFIYCLCVLIFMASGRFLFMGETLVSLVYLLAIAGLFFYHTRLNASLALTAIGSLILLGVSVNSLTEGSYIFPALCLLVILGLFIRNNLINALAIIYLYSVTLFFLFRQVTDIFSISLSIGVILIIYLHMKGRDD